MLTLLPQIDSIADNRTTVTVTDATVYGGLNPARADVGLYLIVQKMSADNAVVDTYTVVGNDADPQTDVSWQFELEEDGWVRILMIAPEDYAAGDTYALYDVVQDPATSIVYRSKQNGNIGNSLANATYWEVVTAEVALNSGEPNESLNLASTVYSVILSPNSEYGFANIIAEASEECCSEGCTLESLKQYVRIAAMIDGMYVRSDRAQYPQGERVARRLEAILEPYL